MALFPCDVCHRRYVGVGSSAYIGWVAGGFNERRKWRLCPQDLEQVQSFVQQLFDLIQVGDELVGDDAEVSNLCSLSCGKPASTTYFAHVYPRGEPMKVYITTRCKDHADLDVFNPTGVAA